MSKHHLPSDYPERIKVLRERLRLSQSELAKLLDTTLATVSKWEAGQSKPAALVWKLIRRMEESGHVLGPGPLAVDPHPVYGAAPAGDRAIDFGANPEVVRAVAEAERLTYGHLASPSFATEISLIDPLPHQRLAVYGHMLPPAAPRFLLADDAGAGKTIMTGLLVREMLTRRLIRRVLIVPPAGLIGNWERELRTLFRLPFRIVLGSEARLGNPFAGPDGDLVIVSVDTLAGDKMFARLQEPATAPYDLVIFDEAHKLSADRMPDFSIRRTDRYRLAEALAGVPQDDEDSRWTLPFQVHHLLLLTATPHMGKEFPYYCLYRLLDSSVFSTIDAFHAFPADARYRYFLRRTKEEMVKYDGEPIYPMRISDTLSYELTQGEISEQKLYDDTTKYISNYYNKARILNRSAARLAMTVFQRRLASSTAALLRSFERRIEKLSALIEAIRTGKLTQDQLEAQQRRLAEVPDVLSTKTSDEEESEDGSEENERSDQEAMGGVVGLSIAELEAERRQVEALLDLARQVSDRADESKFTRLLGVLQDERYRNEKLLIFTEHRDTLDFLVRRLSGLGFAEQVAQIHGGMDFNERQEQVEFFRKAPDKGGAIYMVCTDAAAEGINLQFCWLMVNYDVPWNPARLEQRMGRIHRYGQLHDPVHIVNLVAGKTREGHVVKTLLDKLEEIRRALGKDKVFDVIGKLFEDVSLIQYMEQVAGKPGTADEAAEKIKSQLTREHVDELLAEDRNLYGSGGDVKSHLPSLRDQLRHEELRRLLPGYVRRFVEKALPLVGLAAQGDLGGVFSLKGKWPGAIDPYWPVLEAYPQEQRNRLTIYKPKPTDQAVFLHPGEPIFDLLRAHICSRFAADALRGAVFIDPYAERPYLFHLVLVSICRKADPTVPAYAKEEVLQYRLVGLVQDQQGSLRECPVEYLLILRGGREIPQECAVLAASVPALRARARDDAMEKVVRPLVEQQRKELMASLPERENYLRCGFDFQAAELAGMRTRLAEKVNAGDPRAKAEQTRIKERQKAMAAQKAMALLILRREPELIAADEVTFLAHALVAPSSDIEERKRHDAQVEEIAVRVSWAHEEAKGGVVQDVSKPEGARAAGLADYPGFDLLSRRPVPVGERRAIEVKGRAGVGAVELSENEWAQACTLREGYWLYVVFDCASPAPRLVRVRNPFGKLIAKFKESVVLDAASILAAAEE